MIFATKPEDILPLAENARISGMEFMQRMLSGEISQPPIGATMGFHLHAVSEGSATFRGIPRFEVSNPMGTVHGGWYGAILDSAMACAIMTRVPEGAVYTTLEYKINILRAIPHGHEVDCTGTIDHVGRSTGVAHGEVRSVEDGRLFATGSTTCLVMPYSR